MFVVVNKTAKYFVLDTDDMVVEQYTEDELQGIIDNSGIKISGFPVSNKGIYFNNLLNAFSNGSSDMYCNTMSAKGKINGSYFKVPYLKAYGVVEFLKYARHGACYVGYWEPLVKRDFDIKSMLQILLVNYSCLYKDNRVEYRSIIYMLYDIYMLTVTKNHKTIALDNEFLSIYDNSIKFFRYEDCIVFYDDDIAIKIKKDTLDSIKSTETFNTKSDLMKTGVTRDALSGILTIENGDNVVLQSGKTYVFRENAFIKHLTVNDGAIVKFRPTDSIYVGDLECYDVNFAKKVSGKLIINTSLVFSEDAFINYLQSLSHIFDSDFIKFEVKDYTDKSRIALRNFTKRNDYINQLDFNRIVAVAEQLDDKEYYDKNYVFWSDDSVYSFIAKRFKKYYGIIGNALHPSISILNFMRDVGFYKNFDGIKSFGTPCVVTMWIYEQRINEINKFIDSSYRIKIVEKMLKSLSWVLRQYKLNIYYHSGGDYYVGLIKHLDGKYKDSRISLRDVLVNQTANISFCCLIQALSDTKDLIYKPVMISEVDYNMLSFNVSRYGIAFDRAKFDELLDNEMGSLDADYVTCLSNYWIKLIKKEQEAD
jgi:hypothetical protein